jgi:lysozyme
MKPRLNATRAVRELIKAYEPFLADAERRGRRWVIGWGHRATAKEGASITPDNAELLLIYDALQAQQAVDGVVGADLPKPARDALASFAASIGLSAFKVSDVARLAKAGRHREAAAALDSWVRAEEDGRLVVSDRWLNAAGPRKPYSWNRWKGRPRPLRQRPPRSPR